MKKNVKRVNHGDERLNNFFLHLSNDLDSLTFEGPLRAAAIERLRMRMRKRAEISRPHLRDEAVARFVATNSQVAESIPAQFDKYLAHAAEFIRHVLEKYMKRLDPGSLQESFSRVAILENWRFGPGASHESGEGYGTVARVDAQWAQTNSGYVDTFVKQIRLRNPYWSCLDAERPWVPRLVEGSRLTTVVKNEEQERTIGIEPAGNMLLQLAGARVLEGVLRMVGIDLSTQQAKNKRLARYGSLTGLVATEDLKSASDLISRVLIERTWPAEWVRFFTEVRSPCTTLPDGTLLELKMMSTMGNGCTFPMMTLTLLALIYANRRVRHGGPTRYVDLSLTAVFGDDIIIPVKEHDSLVELLQGVGLLVNTEKSYARGPFRESCGGDYYLGYDVTPFYVKTLRTPEAVYVAINQLLRWASKHKCLLPRSLRFLRSLLNGKELLVPQWLGDTAGIRCVHCPRDYRHLVPVPVRVRYVGKCEAMLAVGGFVEQLNNGDFVYIPRREALKYKVGKARLPNGYLDGWDPSYGSVAEAWFASTLLALTR